MDNSALIATPPQDEIFLGQLARSEMVHGVQLPGFPDEAFQKASVGSSGEQALREAMGFYQDIKHHAAQLRTPVGTSTVLVDFGAGWGRLLRFFMKDIPSSQLIGLDVDPLMVDWCKRTNIAAHSTLVDALPPAPLPDACADIITAYSVFSHLSEKAATAWMQEFARILRPGGIVVATTQARGFIDFCAQLRETLPKNAPQKNAWHEKLALSFTNRQQSLRDYDEGKFLFSPTGGGEARPSSFYGEAIIPQRFMEEHWSPWLTLRWFEENRPYTVQSIFVLQKAA